MLLYHSTCTSVSLTLHQVSHTLAMFSARQLLLPETDFIRLSFITSAIYAFACALTGVMWWEWVIVGGGNANFVFGVRSVCAAVPPATCHLTLFLVVLYRWPTRTPPPPSFTARSPLPFSCPAIASISLPQRVFLRNKEVASI